MSKHKSKKAASPRKPADTTAGLRKALNARTKPELVNALLELARADRGVLRQLTARFDVAAAPKELVAATRQAIADATDFDEREINSNFDYDYEAYEEMADKRMRGLAADARKMFGVRHVTMVHRLGRLEVGETSVLIVVASAHRAQAFEACRWLIDTLKQTVPIWKKEIFVDGAVWAAGEPFPTGMAVAPPEGPHEK